MPTNFGAAFDSSATVDQVHTAFRDRRYWLDRIQALGGDRTLDVFDVANDGTVAVVVTEHLIRDRLSGLLASLYRGEMTVRSEEGWTPTADGGLAGRMRVIVTGAPGSGRGSAAIMSTNGGSRLELEGDLQIGVPMVGSRIEKVVAGQLVEGFAKIQRFTAEWIADHV